MPARKPPRRGRPRTTGRGPSTRVGVNLSLSPAEAARLDAARGDVPRATYLRRLLLPPEPAK